MANYAPILFILLELCLWLWLPARSVARFAWLPTFRTRRFRFHTPEGDESEPPRKERAKALDPSISAALKVARQLDTTVRVEHEKFVKLVRIRARFVGDVLEVRVRHYPEGVIVTTLLGLPVLPDNPVAGLLFILTATPLILVVTWARSRIAAHLLVLELLALARPHPSARALELDREGDLVSVDEPRTLNAVLRDAAVGRPGGALLALASTVAVPISGLVAWIGVQNLSFARNRGDTLSALLVLVVYAALTLLSIAGIFIGARLLVRGRPRERTRVRNED